MIGLVNQELVLFTAKITHFPTNCKEQEKMNDVLLSPLRDTPNGVLRPKVCLAKRRRTRRSKPQENMDEEYHRFLGILAHGKNPYSFDRLKNNKKFVAGGWDILKRCMIETDFCTAETRSNAIIFAGSNVFLFKDKSMMNEIVEILTDIVSKNQYGEVSDAAMGTLFALRGKIPEDENFTLGKLVYNKLQGLIDGKIESIDVLDDLLEKAITEEPPQKKHRNQ